MVQSAIDNWVRLFKAEFLRRTGITWADSGGTEHDAKLWYSPDASVSEMVEAVIEKYELNDITVLN